jgi:lipoprotein-anchoring transpeptidase ErfK/SrfK
MRSDSGDAMKAVAIAVMAAMTMQAGGQSATKQETPDKREIVVSLEDRKLALVEDGKVIRIYPVAVGKASTPSPVGTFTIERRVADPVYQHNGRTIAPGPHNPVGTRWMGLNKAGYGIHGTNEPNSIGKAASHGCIRMAKPDLEELYALVKVGDTVELIGQRNEETAQLFDGAQPAAPVTATVVEPVLAAQLDDENFTPAVDAARAQVNVPVVAAALR